MDYVLSIEPRIHTGSTVKLVRAQGMVPGIIYGQGNAATPIQFKEIDLVRLLRQGAASQLLQLDGLKKKSLFVLLREVQRHPTRRSLLHADFYEVQMGVVIRTEVPVRFEGESLALKAGAVLIHHLDVVEIECLPMQIPEAFIADFDKLETLDDVIKVSDLPVPEGVKVLQNLNDLVISLTISRKLAEDEEFEEDEVGASEPELVTDRDEEEEEE
ncbi:MAG: 50S ribosomal protein L25 [Chloroflexi bacterium]|nr:50S ribosomal protein L25 [Chloroflexota bacterium]